MTWFRVDDTLGTHPKARAAGNRAMGLWVMAGSWSSQQLTEGFVPDWFVGGFPMGRRDAEVLVEVGLWTTAVDGWQFHEWSQSNPTRESELIRRENDRKRKAEWRAAKAAKQNASPNGRDTSRDTGRDVSRDV